MQLPGQWSLKPRSEKGDDVLGVFGGVLVIPCLPPVGASRGRRYLLLF